jgi:hypothetical protein
MKKTCLFLAVLLLWGESTGDSQENGLGKALDPIPSIIAQVAESTYTSHLLGLLGSAHYAGVIQQSPH